MTPIETEPSGDRRHYSSDGVDNAQAEILSGVMEDAHDKIFVRYIPAAGAVSGSDDVGATPRVAAYCVLPERHRLLVRGSSR